MGSKFSDMRSWLRTRNGQAAFSAFVPVLFFALGEWCHRGRLGGSLLLHPEACLIGAFIYLLAYLFVALLSGSHLAAASVTGILAIVPGVVTRFKLDLRGEPFLPWDLSQLGDLARISGNISLKFTAPMLVSAALFLAAAVLAACARPFRLTCLTGLRRAVLSVLPAGALAALYVFLLSSESACASVGIRHMEWMQDVYYDRYGVAVGFLTNLRHTGVKAPDPDDPEAVQGILRQFYGTGTDGQDGGNAAVKPHVLFLMSESFYDVQQLDGVTYSEPLTPNLDRLRGEGLYGKVYSPRYGGGTCDVEFEALTGFSVDYLPYGSKPFMQYMGDGIPSLASWLGGAGYSTWALHGNTGRFWSRDEAYPRLGFEHFVTIDDMDGPELRRGLVSDMETSRQMVRILEQERAGGPVFLHAVSIQNHDSYRAGLHDGSRLVHVSDTAGLDDEERGALEDFATNIRDADEALGWLTDYLADFDEPVVLVFWGDHATPIGFGDVFGKTGAGQPRETELLVWSNFGFGPGVSGLDIGTIAPYTIPPLVTALCGSGRPAFYDFLEAEASVFRSRSDGVTVHGDGSVSEALTPEEQAWYDAHWVLQYDMMFGGNEYGY